MTEDVIGLIPLLFTLGILPAICIAVTRQAAEGGIARNGSSGIRTKHTGASDEAWIAGHRAALPVVRRMWPVAVIGGVIAVAAQLVAGGPSGIILALATILALVVILVRAASAANRAARTA